MRAPAKRRRRCGVAPQARCACCMPAVTRRRHGTEAVTLLPSLLASPRRRARAAARVTRRTPARPALLQPGAPRAAAGKQQRRRSEGVLMHARSDARALPRRRPVVRRRREHRLRIRRACERTPPARVRRAAPSVLHVLVTIKTLRLYYGMRPSKRARRARAAPQLPPSSRPPSRCVRLGLARAASTPRGVSGRRRPRRCVHRPGRGAPCTSSSRLAGWPLPACCAPAGACAVLGRRFGAPCARRCYAFTPIGGPWRRNARGTNLTPARTCADWLRRGHRTRASAA